MFEKEAEEYAKQFMKTHSESDKFINCKRETDNYNVMLAQGYELGFQKGAKSTLRKVIKYFSARVLDENCGGYFSRLLESEEKLQELAKELENV